MGVHSKMANSGVAVTDECVDEFNKIKLKKAYRFLQFRISDDLKKVVVDKWEEASATEASEAEREKQFTDFAGQLPKDDCRYCVYDFHMDMGESGHREKLWFVVWIPETAKIKKKMVYASSKEALKKKLLGMAGELQATDFSELSYKEMKDKMKASFK